MWRYDVAGFEVTCSLYVLKEQLRFNFELLQFVI